MIESGSCTPNVDPSVFQLPRGTALRYEQPDPRLAAFFPSYAVLDSDIDLLDPDRPNEYMLPTWAQIWIVLTAGPIQVRIGNRSYDPLRSAVLYGVTSRAMPTTSNGGTTVAIDVSPLGWARLFGSAAELLRDQITPLTNVLPSEWVEELVTALQASDHAGDIKGILDGFLLRRLPAANIDEPMIATLMALLGDIDTDNIATAAAAAGIDIRTLRRLSKRYFGFPPKLLLMRTRLVRAIVPMLIGKDAGMTQETSYHDASHFNRDGRRFLGMTPRRFQAMPLPYLRAALRARTMVVGSAIAALDSVSLQHSTEVLPTNPQEKCPRIRDTVGSQPTLCSTEANDSRTETSAFRGFSMISE